MIIRLIWLFLKIGDPFVGSPYDESPTVLGSTLRP